MKVAKLAVFGFVALAMSSTHALAETVFNEMVIGAYKADPEVRQARERVTNRLLRKLPGCQLVPVPELQQHLLGASTMKDPYTGQITREKVYLVSSYVLCSQRIGGYVLNVKNAVTAKVRVDVRGPQGAEREIPSRVILVEIENDE